MNEFIYDSYGIEHQRKNIYLLDKARGQKPNKKDNEYLKKLNAFLEEEKKFKDLSRNKLKDFKANLVENERKIRKLLVRLEKAKLNFEFYNQYRSLTYDASIMANIARVEIDTITKIIESFRKTKKELIEFNESIKTIDKKEENYLTLKFKEEKALKKVEFEKEKAKIKNLRDEGIISDKAYVNSLKALKIKIKDELEVIEMQIPSVYFNAKIKSAKYALKNNYKNMLNILELDISDIRRRTPVEVASVPKYLAALTFLIPGLGQLINKQYFKAFLFAILGLFTYFAAIPYILGYGNYRGEGIYGLYSLAIDGGKLDKSMIFMIEGIIALILLCFVITIYYFAYRDVKLVLKNKLRGVRPKTYFETVETLKEEGLPYIVSVVAFILILFIVIMPIVTTILLSFTSMDPKHQSKFAWIGLQNYKLLLEAKGVAGGPFWLIIGWTLVWTVGATSLAIFVGFMLAIIANNERIKGKGIFRIIYLLPWAVPAFITIMYFSIMTSPNGSITNILRNITGMEILIKNSPNYTRLFLILMQTWLGSSYVFLLSTGVLQAIPQDLYEAADIDGSTPLQKLSRITVPLVLFQTAPLLISQYTFNFNNFSIIYLFNQGGPFLPSKYGNIAGSTDLLISYIYKLTINSNYQAAGAAITIFISIALMIVAYIGFKNSKAFKED